MAYFPELPTSPTQTLMTTTFLGLNKSETIADGEAADMQNMTGDAFPVLSTRKHRKEAPWKSDGTSTMANPQLIVGNERLVVADDGIVYIDGEETGLRLSNEASMQPKHIACMGAYICIWPDKVYINTADPDDFGQMGVNWAGGSDPITAVMCRKDGTDYDIESIIAANDPPSEPADGKLWIDTAGDNDILKQYSELYEDWIQVATTYIKIQANGIGKNFKEGDAVFFYGAGVAGNKTSTGQPVTSASEGSIEVGTEAFALKSGFTTSVRLDGQTVNSTPTIAERIRKVEVTGIPTGAIVKSAEISFVAEGAADAVRVLTLNGMKAVVGQNTLPLEVAGNGDVSLRFVYQAAASGKEIGQHASTVAFDSITLRIVYETFDESDSSGDDISSATRLQIAMLNNQGNMLYGAGDNYVIVAGLLRQRVNIGQSLRLEMKIPDVDYVCEANNRIWGCSFAKANGERINEIRACALGDFRNWYLFEGTSMDSYAVSVGSDGIFTGAFSLKGNPLFFKENVLHRISGTQPSNFALNSMQCRGVQDGCWRSMTQVNESLLYKARADVMVYDGALPVSVSEKLGTERYFEASGGSYRDKYYISMRDDDQMWHLFVYDMQKGLWHREDSTKVEWFANVQGDMVAIIPGDPARLVSFNSADGDVEPPFDWSVTFGVYGYEQENQKYLSRFNIRAQLDAGAWMRMEIMYDSDGRWMDEGVIRCPMRRTFMIPVLPRRCDHCQIRLSGKGDAKVYSISRVLEVGGDG